MHAACITINKITPQVMKQTEIRKKTIGWKHLWLCVLIRRRYCYDYIWCVVGVFPTNSKQNHLLNFIHTHKLVSACKRKIGPDFRLYMCVCECVRYTSRFMYEGIKQAIHNFCWNPYTIRAKNKHRFSTLFPSN